MADPWQYRDDACTQCGTLETLAANKHLDCFRAFLANDEVDEMQLAQLLLLVGEKGELEWSQQLLKVLLEDESVYDYESARLDLMLGAVNGEQLMYMQQLGTPIPDPSHLLRYIAQYGTLPMFVHVHQVSQEPIEYGMLELANKHNSKEQALVDYIHTEYAKQLEQFRGAKSEKERETYHANQEQKVYEKCGTIAERIQRGEIGRNESENYMLQKSFDAMLEQMMGDLNLEEEEEEEK